MRSYYAHLETASPAEAGPIALRPTFRSSAIFPVLQNKQISSRILFLGYWILKRHIQEIAAVISVRSAAGKLVTRKNLLIQEAKPYRIELSEELHRAGIPSNEDFIGSMEVEFFSTQNLFFPYPAVVINYYGPSFSTVVHTAQRVYNDFEDLKKNSQVAVPESGFNLYADEEHEPFIGLINGSEAADLNQVTLEFINNENEILQGTLNLGQLNPYETKFIYPARSFELQRFLRNQPGAAKIYFNVKWIFPRLLVGNVHHQIHALTITHTYYDCSAACAESDYWRPSEPGWHDAALMLPGVVSKGHFTNVYFYPIYSPSIFSIDVEIYDEKGKKKGEKRQAALIRSPKMQVHCLSVASICKELNLPLSADYAIRLIAKPQDNSRIPARIKIGLDIGMIGQKTACNICTNLQPFNPSLENKPTSFRWSPFLADQSTATIWIMNSSPAVNYQRPAELLLTFFHEEDTHTLTRSLTLSPHGFIVLKLAEDPELANFFNGKVGWMTLTTTNPYTTTYYFAENPSGVVGGDHGF